MPLAKLLRLLELESRAESRQAAEQARRLSPSEAERAGTSLIDLVVVDEDTGMGGRSLLELAKRRRLPLPWTRLGIGSPVVLSCDGSQTQAARHGVVFERGEATLRIALAGPPGELGDLEKLRLDLSCDQVAVDRCRAALRRALSARGDRLAQLRDVLLGHRPPRFHAEREEPLPPSDLNEPQRAAIRFALSAADVALIHGPPGTGKTTAVAELIRQAVARGEKVLACAPSNLAVDNLLEKLISARQRAIRLGHPARVTPELRAHTLDLLVEQHADVRLSRKLVKEAMGLFRQAARYTRAKPAPGARQQARRDAKELLADARRLESQAAQHLLDTSDVVCATTTGLDAEILGGRRFDLAVIDEACQSTEPGCWIPIQWCDRVILAGDHRQLPPTVVSQEAANEGFGISLFERLMALGGEAVSRRLSVQYRMHEAIMGFSSHEFYDGALEAHPSVSRHLLADLPDADALGITQTPLELIDTAGASFDEELEPDGESRLNREEAAIVDRKVRELIEAGVAPSEIAVIAPYAAQVRLLREQIDVEGLQVDSVDGFQGREKEAVVISLVRSNPRGEIGFLGDVRRMNVAMTRARRKLIVIGDTATLSSHPFYQRMFEYFESLGAYRSVWEEPG